MELVVLMNFSITQSIESSSFPISSQRISNIYCDDLFLSFVQDIYTYPILQIFLVTEIIHLR